jgi:site-specific recombinase XerD
MKRVSTIMYENALSRLTASLAEKGKSPHTQKAYETDCRLFFDWAGPRYWGMTTDRDAYTAIAANYLNAYRRDWSASTTARKVTALRYLGRVLFPGESILQDYTPPRASKGYAHPLPKGMDDMRRLLETARRPDQRAFLALCGLAGLRVSEARLVRHGDFSVDDHGVMWVTVLGKGDRERSVPLSIACRKYVEPVLKAQPREYVFSFGDRAARAFITRLGKRAGIDRNIASHDLRMTFGTSVFGASKDIRATQELLGHASSTTTEVYTAVSETTKRAAVAIGADWKE